MPVLLNYAAQFQSPTELPKLELQNQDVNGDMYWRKFIPDFLERINNPSNTKSTFLKNISYLSAKRPDGSDEVMGFWRPSIGDKMNETFNHPRNYKQNKKRIDESNGTTNMVLRSIFNEMFSVENTEEESQLTTQQTEFIHYFYETVTSNVFFTEKQFAKNFFEAHRTSATRVTTDLSSPENLKDPGFIYLLNTIIIAGAKTCNASLPSEVNPKHISLEALKGFSTDNLSAQEVFDILGEVQERSLALRNLAFLYSNTPEISGFLLKEYGLTPEKFTHIFSSSINPIFNRLSKEYDVDMSFSKKKVDTLPSLEVKINFISRKVIERARKKFFALPNDNGQEKKYGDYVRFLKNHYSLIGEWIHQAGGFSFVLNSEMQNERTFDMLINRGVDFRTRASGGIPMDVDEYRDAVPTPLVPMGSQIHDFVDPVYKAGERLLGEISKQSHIPICVVTSPLSDEEKDTEMRGYRKVDEFINGESTSDFKSDFIKTANYQEGYYHDRRFKLIHR